MTQNYFGDQGQPAPEWGSPQPGSGWPVAILDELRKIRVAVEQIALESVNVNTHSTPQPAPLRVATPSQPVGPAGAWLCPVHGTPAKLVPGGFSSKTNRDYPPFWACETPYCNQRPPRQNGSGQPQQAQVAPQGPQVLP